MGTRSQKFTHSTYWRLVGEVWLRHIHRLTVRNHHWVGWLLQDKINNINVRQINALSVVMLPTFTCLVGLTVHNT